MKDQIVSFKTAKLAKEKGINFNVDRIYNADGTLVTVFADKTFVDNNNWYLAPSQTLLQKWLREKHKLIVWCIPFIDDFICIASKEHPSFAEGKIIYRSENGNYEDVLEKGLQEALKII